jgi:hypothetical protein
MKALNTCLRLHDLWGQTLGAFGQKMFGDTKKSANGVRIAAGVTLAASNMLTAASIYGNATNGNFSWAAAGVTESAYLISSLGNILHRTGAVMYDECGKEDERMPSPKELMKTALHLLLCGASADEQEPLPAPSQEKKLFNCANRAFTSAYIISGLLAAPMLAEMGMTARQIPIEDEFYQTATVMSLFSLGLLALSNFRTLTSPWQTRLENIKQETSQQTFVLT